MKTEFKHTKGEWKLSSDKILEIIRKDENNPSDFKIFSVDTEDHYACILSFHKKEEEAEANAKLIAAAPELLQSLNDLCEIVSPIIYKMGVKKAFSELLALETAKKAIKKAIE